MGSSRQEYWSRLPCSPPGDLPNLGIEPMLPESPALQADSLPTKAPGNPRITRDLAIPLQFIYPKELKVGSQRHISTPMFTEALFTIAKE